MSKQSAPVWPRFDARYVVRENGCWEWTGTRFANGYAHIKVNGRACYAHRLSYERVNGAIPAGMQIDHTCRNRACVNPEHLEVVTQRENLRRARPFAAKRKPRELCKRGHSFSTENTYIDPHGLRRCRQCRKMNRPDPQGNSHAC